MTDKIEMASLKILEWCEGTLKTHTLKGGKVESVSSDLKTTSNIYKRFNNFFRGLYLPDGYPLTVSQDYLDYQIWDTLQAFCSTISGNFTTRAILSEIGVGNAEATALSATITWILKDGTGMASRILFTWWKGSELDRNCKKWRFFADVLNDCAMLIELCLPYIPGSSMNVLCITSAMKSVVGVVGGATRAAITQHQAISNNMAEVSAKDGSQETIVNLIGSLLSICFLSVITNPVCEVIFVIILMALHLICNFKAVKSLVFDTFNEERLSLYVKHAVNNDLSKCTLRAINNKESIFLGTAYNVSDTCLCKIKLGASLNESIRLYGFSGLTSLFGIFKRYNYMVVPDAQKRYIYVMFKSDYKAQDVIEAYFHATLLAFSACWFADIPGDYRNHMGSTIGELLNITKHTTPYNTKEKNLSLKQLAAINNFIETLLGNFSDKMEINGWSLESHYLPVQPWISDWEVFYKKDN